MKLGFCCPYGCWYYWRIYVSICCSKVRGYDSGDGGDDDKKLVNGIWKEGAVLVAKYRGFLGACNHAKPSVNGYKAEP